MVHRGTTRESKQKRAIRVSTLDDKLRRHRNKARIWRRCLARLAALAKDEQPALVGSAVVVESR